MGIDKHLVLTLKRSTQRHWAMLGGSYAMQTPLDKIHFVEGHDNRKFNDNMKAVAIAAENDGFPYVHHFARGVKSNDLGQSASGACQVWNYSRILRYIANGTETCMITWDDRILSLPYPWIDRITTELQKRDEEFYFFQLRVRIGDVYNDNERICLFYPDLVEEPEEHLELMERDYMMFNQNLDTKWRLDFQRFRETHYKNPEVLTSPKKYIAKYLQKNRLGYDESMVISPQGAAWLLLQVFDIKDLDHTNEPEELKHWDTVVHQRNTFDSWLIRDLDEPVTKAIAENKGMYCPKQLGYRYVHDWLPMGSSVHWANSQNKYLDALRTRTTAINFLEIS